MVGLHAADLDKMPNELSGGMLRRAALAQLLAQQKRVIVLDEPFVGLGAGGCRAEGWGAGASAWATELTGA